MMRFLNILLGAGLAWGTILGGVGLASEQVNLIMSSGSSSGITIPVSDLRTFAQTGQAQGNLQAILTLLTPELQADFRKALQINRPVDVATLETRLQSENGTKILQGLAAAILHPESAGVQTLQSTILKTAANPQGFNLLDFIAAYPEPVFNIDVNQMKALIDSNEKLVALAQKELQQASPSP